MTPAWLKSAAADVWRLFVDDVGLAIAAIGWVGVVGLIASRPTLAPAAGPAMFAGLALILAISALWRSGKR